MSALDHSKMNRRRAGSMVPGGPIHMSLVTEAQRNLIVRLCSELDEPYPGIGPRMSRADASQLIDTLLQRKRVT